MENQEIFRFISGLVFCSHSENVIFSLADQYGADIWLGFTTNRFQAHISRISSAFFPSFTSFIFIDFVLAAAPSRTQSYTFHFIKYSFIGPSIFAVTHLIYCPGPAPAPAQSYYFKSKYSLSLSVQFRRFICNSDAAAGAENPSVKFSSFNILYRMFEWNYSTELRRKLPNYRLLQPTFSNNHRNVCIICQFICINWHDSNGDTCAFSFK